MRTRPTSSAALLVLAIVSTAAAGEPGRPRTGDPPAPPRDPSPAGRPAPPRDPSPAEVAAQKTPGLVRRVRPERDVPLDPLWNIALLPERFIETLFFPIGGLVSWIEHNRIDRRVVDLLSGGEHSYEITPKVKFGFPDGLGLGAVLTLTEIMGTDGRLDVGGTVRINRDFDLAARYRQTFARLEGRMLEAHAGVEVDSNEPYFGIGGETREEDRRALGIETVGASATLDINALGSLFFTGDILLGYTHVELEPGRDSTVAPVGEPGDAVKPPPGFGHGLDFPELGVDLVIDTRDRLGRPTRGTLARLHGSLTADLGDSDLSAAYGELTVNQFIQILPLYRILVLTAGFGATTPLEPDGRVPYHELVTLGRDHFLRGYNRGRFKDRFGWWASAQYEFPITEYMNTDVALNAALFLDTGRVGGGVDELVSGPIRYSYGFGLGIAHTSKSIVSLSLGHSKEGFEFVFAGGLEL